MTVDTVNDKCDQETAEHMAAIAVGHAWIAFGKRPEDREAYLRQCCRNWRQDAFAASGDQVASERYAEELDRATRKLLSAMLRGGTPAAGTA